MQITELKAATLEAQRIPIEVFPILSTAPSSVAVQGLLVGEVPGVAADLVTIGGPAQFRDSGDLNHEVVWLFIGGPAALHTRNLDYKLTEETIARAPLGWAWSIEVEAGQTLRAIRIRKELSVGDRGELAKFAENNAAPWIRRFLDCPSYTEAIKSPGTVSRTLLPENFVPRMAIGTVEATGPDRVGRHKHPMLEQYFIGLQGNDATVSADAVNILFPEFSILHIPLGSMHGTEVPAGKRLYYVWLDFFTTKEGQEWLKMHKPAHEK
jgi:quercetin dioxygenase-like cupin family protein